METMNRILTQGKRFVDEHGRQRIFHGINICEKGVFDGRKLSYPFDVTVEELETLRDSGMNLIRLGFTWDAVEHEMGTYNEEFLNRIEALLDWFAANGMHAFLDVHQDLYSSFDTFTGDGAPAWACLSDGYKAKPPKAVWAEGYFWGKAVHRCFDNFWANKEVAGRGLQDRYCDMWAHLAQRFGSHPAVFGFDIMNEPFPGTPGGALFRKLALGLAKTTLTHKSVNRKAVFKGVVSPQNSHLIFNAVTVDVMKELAAKVAPIIARFDREHFTPFINKVSAVIREKTANGIIIFENCYYSNLGIPCHNGPVCIKGKTEPHQAFSPHAYDLMVDTPLYKYADNNRVAFIFGQRKKEQDTRLDMPVLVGEWGGNSEGTEWLPHVEYLLDLFDSYQWSNCYWVYYKGFNSSYVIDVLRRSYPQAVTGNIISYKHDRKSNTFTLCYEQDREYDAPTEIFIHKEIETIEADGEITVEKRAGTASIVKIKTAPGKHTVTVNLR